MTTVRSRCHLFSSFSSSHLAPWFCSPHLPLHGLCVPAALEYHFCLVRHHSHPVLLSLTGQPVLLSVLYLEFHLHQYSGSSFHHLHQCGLFPFPPFFLKVGKEKTKQMKCLLGCWLQHLYAPHPGRLASWDLLLVCEEHSCRWVNQPRERGFHPNHHSVRDPVQLPPLQCQCCSQLHFPNCPHEWSLGYQRGLYSHRRRCHPRCSFDLDSSQLWADLLRKHRLLLGVVDSGSHCKSFFPSLKP